jgi:shikimate dehydrogenase
MFQVGLIGKNLSHSFSKSYFEQKFAKESIYNVSYSNFQLNEINELEYLIQTNDKIVGFNVTIPYKELIIPFLSKKSIEVTKIGAVNTVLVERFGNKIELAGYNTDYIGFEKTLEKVHRKKILNSKALIFGTGGASKAVAYTLENLNITYKKVSRKRNNLYLTYNDLNKEIISEHLLLINCTPLGMFPDINQKVQIPYEYVTQNHILIDLIYNPDITQFMKEGYKKGAIVINGLTMLHEQAEEAWKLFKTKISN